MGKDMYICRIKTETKINNYKMWHFWKKKKDPNLVELFRSGGHVFYSWKHFDNMPAFREMFVRYHYAKMARGINNADLLAFCNTILKFNNDRKRDDITALVKFFEQHIQEYANEKIILELAGYVVLVDDEPVDDVTDEYMEIKRQVLKDDRKARFFFQGQALKLLQTLSKDLDILNLKAYLENSNRRERETIFLQLISSNLTDNLWRH